MTESNTPKLYAVTFGGIEGADLLDEWQKDVLRSIPGNESEMDIYEMNRAMNRQELVEHFYTTTAEAILADMK